MIVPIRLSPLAVSPRAAASALGRAMETASAAPPARTSRRECLLDTPATSAIRVPCRFPHEIARRLRVHPGDAVGAGLITGVGMGRVSRMLAQSGSPLASPTESGMRYVYESDGDDWFAETIATSAELGALF